MKLYIDRIKDQRIDATTDLIAIPRHKLQVDRDDKATQQSCFRDASLVPPSIYVIQGKEKGTSVPQTFRTFGGSESKSAIQECHHQQCWLIVSIVNMCSVSARDRGKISNLL